MAVVLKRGRETSILQVVALAFSVHYIIISAHSPGNVNRLDPVLSVPEVAHNSFRQVSELAMAHLV